MKKIIVDRGQLLTALKVAALASKISEVFIRASGSTCVVSCDGVAIAASMTIPCKSHGALHISMPLMDLLRSVEAFPDGALVIESVGTDGPTHRLYPEATPRDRYTFVAVPATEGNLTAVTEMGVCDRDELRRMLSSCKVAAATDETRPHLCSVLLEPTESGVVAVATDGHRMHVAQSASRLVSEAVILPANAVAALLRLLAMPGEVLASFRDSWFRVSVGDARLDIRTVQGEFPPWRKVLPASSPGVTVHSGALRSAMARVGLVTTDSCGARIRLVGHSAAPRALQVMGQNLDREMNAEVDWIELDPGAAMDTMVNARYLTQAIDAVAADHDEVILQSGGPLEPLLLCVSDGTAQAIVMPMATPKAGVKP